VNTQHNPSNSADPPSVAKTGSVVAADGAGTTSTTTAPTSSLLAQLSYAQPSIELLRRRQAQNTDHISLSENPSESHVKPVSASGNHGHLLSSATIAALAALANTPRR